MQARVVTPTRQPSATTDNSHQSTAFIDYTFSLMSKYWSFRAPHGILQQLLNSVACAEVLCKESRRNMDSSISSTVTGSLSSFPHSCQSFDLQLLSPAGSGNVGKRSRRSSVCCYELRSSVGSTKIVQKPNHPATVTSDISQPEHVKAVQRCRSCLMIMGRVGLVRHVMNLDSGDGVLCTGRQRD